MPSFMPSSMPSFRMASAEMAEEARMKLFADRSALATSTAR